MERDYADSIETTPNYFFGREVEHSPAFDMRTMFVVGVQPTEDILSKAISNNIEHVYFGANQSFNPANVFEWDQWSDMIIAVLKYRHVNTKLWVTLDLDVSHVAALHESGLTEYRKFIPMISVKLPYVSLFNYNTTIKIDDTGFEASNPGVWCHRLHDLTTPDKFTDWDRYLDDTIESDRN